MATTRRVASFSVLLLDLCTRSSASPSEASFVPASSKMSPTPRQNPPATKRLESAASTASTSALSSASSSVTDASASSFPPSADTITILGLGSLLSERSSRTTFPDLRNFRLGRVPDHRRVFGHPASIFFQRGIADMDTKEICSLCAEREDAAAAALEGEEGGGGGGGGGPGFVCSIFEVPNDGMMEDPDGTGAFVPSRAYLEREEEFDIALVPYEELDCESPTGGSALRGRGVLCLRSTDEAYVARWGAERFEKHYGRYGIDTIWGWPRDSEIRPCGPYLRHCVLAAERMGKVCLDSFLDETFLVDRETTIRDYLEKHPEVMETLPPPHLAVRYGG